MQGTEESNKKCSKDLDFNVGGIGIDARLLLVYSFTELAKAVCPRLRDPASGRGAISRNIGQTCLAISV